MKTYKSYQKYSYLIFYIFSKRIIVFLKNCNFVLPVLRLKN